MNEEDRGAVRGSGYTYRRRYLDEDAWEPVDVGVLERALTDVYRDVLLALEFLTRRAAFVRQPPCMKPGALDPSSAGILAQRSHTTP